MIIAIDGPVGVGKSTVARAVADRLGFLHIDTGAMYRAVAWKILQTGANFQDQATVAETARKTIIVLEAEHNGLRVYCDGQDITDAIRRPEIDAATPPIADNVEVRACLVEQQRALGVQRDVVMEGRDIGTVVFPQAQLKVYLDASVRVRALRRAKDLQARGFEIPLAQLEDTVHQRDERDRMRPVGALRVAQDARVVDTSDMTFEQVVSKIVELASLRQNPSNQASGSTR